MTRPAAEFAHVCTIQGFPVALQLPAPPLRALRAKGQVGLSTKTLEPEPGDMIRNPAKVYAEAEATAAKSAPPDRAHRLRLFGMTLLAV